MKADAGKVDQVVQDVVGRRAAEGWPDLTRPPVQLTLVGDVIVFSLHHVLYDAFSIEMLVRDFASLYRGGDLVSSNAWVEAVEHVAEEQQHRRGDAERYWSEALANADSGLLRKESAASTDGEAFQLEPRAITVSSAMDSKLRKAGLTLPAVILAAWSTLLSERIACASPVFGLYQLGRSSSFDSIERCKARYSTVYPAARGRFAVGESQSRHNPPQAAWKIRTDGHGRRPPLVGLPTDKPSYNTFVNISSAPSTTISPSSWNRSSLITRSPTPRLRTAPSSAKRQRRLQG